MAEADPLTGVRPTSGGEARSNTNLSLDMVVAFKRQRGSQDENKNSFG